MKLSRRNLILGTFAFPFVGYKSKFWWPKLTYTQKLIKLTKQVIKRQFKPSPVALFLSKN